MSSAFALALAACAAAVIAHSAALRAEAPSTGREVGDRPIAFQPASVPSEVRGYVEELKARARSKRLDRAEPWRRLGHWRDGWIWGPATEIDGPTFFLAPRGAHDPAAELAATLDAFSQPPDSTNEKNHAQCRYPARRRWLYQALAIDRKRLPWHPCTELEAWKTRFDADGVSLVFASAYLNNAASMFGHTFLKFHGRANKDDRDLLNYGVNFSAHTGGDGGAGFAVRGLFGGYRGYFSMLPYHQTLNEYSNLEGRDIWEYRLALSPRELEGLIEHLLELEQTWFDYFFFDENCSYQLLAALDAAKPGLGLSDRLSRFVIPADVVRLAAREPGLTVSTSFRPSLSAQFSQLLLRLEGAEKAKAKALVRAPDDRFEAALAEAKAQEPAAAARTLDASLLYSSILSGGKPEPLKSRDHRLKIARASLGIASPPIDWAGYESKRPEEGHDSSLIGAGFGRREGSDFQTLMARAAYHDLLSRDAGFLRNTRLEVMRTQIRRYEEPAGVQLHEIQVVDLYAATPWTRFAKPLSWAARFGWSQPLDRPRAKALPFSLGGGLGAAVQPFAGDFLTIAAMGLGAFDAADDLNLGYRLGATAQAQALFRFSEALHASLGAEQSWFVLGETSEFPGLWARGTYAFSRNWEARLQHARARDITENQAFVAWHFLF